MDFCSVLEQLANCGNLHQTTCTNDGSIEPIIWEIKTKEQYDQLFLNHKLPRSYQLQ